MLGTYPNAKIMRTVITRLLCSATAGKQVNPTKGIRLDNNIIGNSFQLPFVPTHANASEESLNSLHKLLSGSNRLLVMTGAGISTESGIPDYRGEGVGLYATSKRRPILHKTFMESAPGRQSYWARNFVGWPRWSNIKANSAHLVLADWERQGWIHHIVTQNVDQLHYKAGCSKVVELHGTTAVVKCMSCTFSIPRLPFQNYLSEANPGFETRAITEIRPDGDVELSASEVAAFKIPACPKCGTGILKPDVVFFGDNVPKDRVDFVRKLINESDSLMVVGSSLYVFSGYRFVLQAKEEGKPVAIVNIGPTRADHMADIKIDARATQVLNWLNTYRYKMNNKA